MSEEKHPFRPPVTCVRCNKELKEAYPDQTGGSYGMVDGGVIGRLHGPFGSRHDGSIFQIAICDECIDAIKLPVLGHYMFPDMDEAIKSGSFNYYQEVKSASKHSNPA